MRGIGRRTILLVLLFCGRITADTGVTPIEFSSGGRHVTLIEFYTSEGCSSCPPADLWLSSLKEDAGLWKEFTPVAFHVDYWDYIGWEDRFARAEYSDRQRRYAAEGGSWTVYTPGVFADGRAWHGWRRGTRVLPGSSTGGELTVRVEGQDVAVRFNPNSVENSELTLHFAVLGMGLETRVRSGENEGRTLRHDFVAFNLDSVPLENVGGSYRAMMRMPAITIQPKQRAIVAWVSTNEVQAPIQSVGGFLPGN